MMVKKQRLFPGISQEPNIMGGKPCIQGTRITVGQICKMVGSGTPMEQMMDSYPSLTKENILEAILYAGELANEEKAPPVSQDEDEESAQLDTPRKRMSRAIDEALLEEYPFVAKLTKRCSILEESEQDQFWGAMDVRYKNDILEKALRKEGFGPDKLYLNEWNLSHYELYQYPSVYDVDRAEWEWQKSHENSPIQPDENYEIYLGGEWFRCLWDDRLMHGELIGLHFHIYHYLEEVIHDISRGLFPRKEHPLFEEDDEEDSDEDTPFKTVRLRGIQVYGKQEDYEEFFRWEMGFMRELFDALKQWSLDNFSGQIFYTIDEENREEDPFVQIVFCDSVSTKKVRFSHFVEDILKHAGNYALLENEIQRWKQKVKRDFLEKYDKWVNQKQPVSFSHP